jgi:hypothetical protein
MMRLPATFERRWEDNPAYDYYYPQPGTPSSPLPRRQRLTAT